MALVVTVASVQLVLLAAMVVKVVQVEMLWRPPAVAPVVTGATVPLAAPTVVTAVTEAVQLKSALVATVQLPLAVMVVTEERQVQLVTHPVSA